MKDTKEKMSFSDIIHSGKPVLVDFFAEWCGPCKMMAPALEELKKKMGDKVHVIKIDVDKNPGAAAKFNIQGVPTLIIFHKGNAVWRQSGVIPVNQLEKMLGSYLLN